MYERHFGLQVRPFSILPDPHFLYLGRHHQIAYAMLEYGLVGQAGFTVITGAIGSGKTTLVHKLVHSIPGMPVTLGLISTTSIASGTLMEWIMMAFRQPFEGLSYPRLHRDFGDFLLRQAESGRRVVLVIDEAQNLKAERLEELRMLSNLNVDRMLLQLVLVGQPELRQMLREPSMRQLAQRVSSDFHLPPLARTDAVPYFEHRLRVAGGRPGIFSRPAIYEIFDYAKGTPRSLNIVADKCLVYGFSDGVAKIGRRIVGRVIADIEQYGIYNPSDNPVDMPVAALQA
ncbi:MAG: AAA family ATPase [Candidatus Devosia phytovorans]|uniref:AAA family ATPase n=1 Tax=Candidatus Devosia phytovorans TaxID=3121372 RepID=A0AAJ5VTN0_9HYPH|nr:AAA family ATPase [Devosia sp.]WEK03720.1 MAG: AAA family ATPase [Devosia sp.]